MIFSTGLKKIYESIGKQPADKQEALLNSLHEKIANSKALAHKFSLLDIIQENKNNLSKVQAKKFVAMLEAKHNKFMKENNEVAIFYKEEKKLFEFFNINQKEVISEKLDLIVNKKDNRLNESIILNYVTNPNLLSLQESLAIYRPIMKEYFSSVKSTKEVDELDNALNSISFRANLLEGDRKKMVKAAVTSIFEESINNFDAAVEKAYKLEMMTEKFLKEYTAEDEDDDSYFDAYEDEDANDAVTDIEPDADDDSFIKGKTLTAPSLEFLQKITYDVPTGNGADYVFFKFVIPIYPNSVNLADNLDGLPKLRVQLTKLSRYFKQAVIKMGNGLFTTNDMQFDVKLATSYGYKEIAAGKYPMAKFSVFMSTNEDVSLKNFPRDAKGKIDFVGAYSKAAYSVLKYFDGMLLSNQDIASYLTPEVMQHALANSDGKRNAKYTNRGDGPKYYKDKRTVSKDKWMDDVLIQGDTRAEHGEENLDVDPRLGLDSGKGIMPGSVESDDDIIDREATQNAMTQKKKPTLIKKAA